MERSAMFGRSAPLCQPSCSRPQGRTCVDKLVTCVATPAKPPTAKKAKRFAHFSAFMQKKCYTVVRAREAMTLLFYLKRTPLAQSMFIPAVAISGTAYNQNLPCGSFGGLCPSRMSFVEFLFLRRATQLRSENRVSRACCALCMCTISL